MTTGVVRPMMALVVALGVSWGFAKGLDTAPLRRATYRVK
jgi:hypothetical protein